MRAAIVFWFLVALITYVYVGYPALLRVLTLSRRRQSYLSRSAFQPTVSIIIAAHNEAKVIAQKLENTFELDYLPSKMEVIVVSDGSTDETADIVRRFKGSAVKLIESRRNAGKSSAQNAAVSQSHGTILIFTDANVTLRRDAVRQLIGHFAGERVGCVVGRVTYRNEDETTVSEGEGLYWRYELKLRQMESDAGILLAGSGPIIALRRSLFQPLDPAVSEDFVLPMQAAVRGYRTVFEPNAISSERLFQVTPRDMLMTRARTITLDTRSIFVCRSILNLVRYPLHAWGLLSHKVLRWLVPYFLIALFVTNIFLLSSLFYALTMGAQLVFYALAVVAFRWRSGEKAPPWCGVPLSFCLVNLSALIGLARFAIGAKSGRWIPVRT